MSNTILLLEELWLRYCCKPRTSISDGFLKATRQSLPTDLAPLLNDLSLQLIRGHYEVLLSNPDVKILLGHEDNEDTKNVVFDETTGWNDYIFRRLGILLSKRTEEDESRPRHRTGYHQHLFFFVAIAALQAFVQSNVTGPPLPFKPEDLLLPPQIVSHRDALKGVRSSLIRSLSVDGEAAYALTPNIELLCLADAILTCPPIVKSVRFLPWARLRVDFMHQRLVNESSPKLQESIYDNMALVRELLQNEDSFARLEDVRTEFAMECATIHTHHGFDKLAREELNNAARRRRFEYALTGRLGKRTKYQERDLSQLVVLARSETRQSSPASSSPANGRSENPAPQPESLDLNDDTLLESISFRQDETTPSTVNDEKFIPKSLLLLDPGKQPQLEPLDSVILLSIASSITNTSPADGLTREETLPYATRVLDGGSSNWQIYTQALLVRSRIEGYKSRTTERGLLQLQALVDQVIAETSGNAAAISGTNGSTSFLPLPKPSESAPVTERIRFIYQLNTPTRWELEAELAARWVSLGGLRSALDIYSRLEMWAEAALCWAATDRENEAERIVRRQLYNSTAEVADADVDDETETWQGPPRDPPPNDAARLYCILGDLKSDPQMYEKAWEVSNQRYARAQRSLGRLYFSQNDFKQSAAAYSKSLRANQLNQSSWFVLGCALLNLSEWDKAAEAFSRSVQLDETDAEAWSNLATALLRKGSSPDTNGHTTKPSESTLASLQTEEDREEPPTKKSDPQEHKHQAFKALKRAATLKHESSLIWSNLLTVAASLTPPSYADIITAQRRIIELRGKTDGEKCIDVDILELVARHVITTFEPPPAPTEGHQDETTHLHGLPRMLIDLLNNSVTPLITFQPRLWRIIASLSLWRSLPATALASHEKAYRASTRSSSIHGSTEQFETVAEMTLELADAYESLGPRENSEVGGGELVAKDWKFKARSVVRGVVGKARDAWEGTEGFGRLEGRLEELKKVPVEN